MAVEVGVVESEWRAPRHWQAAYQQNAARSSDKHGLVCASQVSEVSQSIKEVKFFGPKHLFLHTDTFKPFILYAAIHAEACFSVENLLEDQHYSELY